jgi:ArsR family transcriptional regulator
MKSAYPASPSLDLSGCQYLSLEMSHEVVTEEADVEAGGADGVSVDPSEVAGLVEELDELEDLERELSLAQRWVQGQIASVLDRLSETIDSEEYLDTEILAALANGAGDVEEISPEVGVPPGVVEDHLRRLERRGIIEYDGGEWRLAEA